ncbi:uncharacterized protein MP3633_3112 [Marinomonas primoryensis]|uniref:type I site-specific deoxyribonuclease n=1 Tax=Marinomonas primoryensis TaxID=178399 RepID=A0A859D4J2_9GAMM|nr:uncharacterized protein MP3633_3112 [Marinomonas primoryensis]
MAGESLNTNEEHSSKIPALTLLSNLGYEFIPPSACLAQRGKSSVVILPHVLREVLAKQRFSYLGKLRSLSEESIDKIVHQLANPAMNEGLSAANEKLYDALTYGITVTEFIDGKKTQPNHSNDRLANARQQRIPFYRRADSGKHPWHGQMYPRYCVFCEWLALGGDRGEASSVQPKRES